MYSTTTVVSFPPSPLSGVLHGHGHCSLGDLSRLTRVGFLTLALSPPLPSSGHFGLSGSLPAFHCPSVSIGLHSFPTFRGEAPLSSLSTAVLRSFSHLFPQTGFRPPTRSDYYAALKDLLWYGFWVVVDDRLLALACRGWFHQRLPSRAPVPSRSLQKVLDLLSSPAFCTSPSLDLLFKKALFLVSLYMGSWVSQVHALTRYPGWTFLAPDLSEVSLAPSPRFLAK